MSEQKLISPLLDQFVMGKPISEHHGVCCCPAMTKDGNKRYIVKIISIPASQVQLDALLLAGAYSNKMAALSYFRELADGIAEEAEVLKKLSRFEGFVPYEDLQITEMENGNIGYQVYLLSPYKLSLERHMRKNPMTQLKAVNLGLDLCASMVMCRRTGYLYVDLKPTNIYINEKNEYCIGDLGFVRLDSLKYASLPDKYRSAYTAPELDDALSSLNETIDTYAIGMILYQIYNDGKLPEDGEPVAPAYADYEMAEIILKAIHPDPQQRWQDPMEMGQALVAYMQRNSVNDVPIIPLPEPAAAPAEAVADTPAEVPADASAEAPEEVPAELPPETDPEPETIPPQTEDAPPADASDAAPAEADPVPAEETQLPPDPAAEPENPATADPTDLTFMDNMVQDDTTPGEDTVEDVTYDDLSDETSDILAQADELLAMPVPEPVVAPEPIEVSVPAPIVPDETETAPISAAAAVPAEGEAPPAEDPQDNDPPTTEAPQEIHPVVPVVPETPAVDEEPEEELPPEPKKKGKALRITAIIIVIALLLGAAAFGYYYYQNEYLQYIDDIQIVGTKDQMTVTLVTVIEDALLKVSCSDSYGNTIPGTISNGVAVFQNLKSDTIYQVTVSMDGFHELRGDTTGTYTTPSQTNITHFEATAGSEPGSVILTFTVEGKDTNYWTITYSTEGEVEKTQTFSGHILALNDLTPGKEYTFRLSGDDSLYMVGQDTVTFTVSPLIFAENLSITQCNTEGLTVVWTAPTGAEDILWSVRCYSDNGFDQTVETKDLTMTFTGIDPSQAYTVEVTAENMSTGTMTHISARSTSITGSTADTSVPLTLTVNWTFEGNAPQGGWLVTYGVRDSDVTQTILVTESSLSIYPAMPDDVYDFSVATADGITVFNNTFSHKAGPVKVFSGYGVNADKMSFSMCLTPNKTNWTWKDLNTNSYRDTFKSGAKVSFLVKLSGKYQKSDDYIDILFVVRDKNKDIVCTSSTGGSWTYLWDDGYCELDIPTMPTKAGSYTIDVYFNGMAVSRVLFHIQ